MKSKKIAVIGVSQDERKYGFKIFRDLLSAGYDISGVNPKGGTILNKKIYKSLDGIPYQIDTVITVVPPDVTEKVVDFCIALGIKEIWMQPGSESERAIKKAEDAGIKVTHHACFMVFKGIWK